jgi:hypothetical protein
MYWWKSFDIGEVRDEFAQMAELGAALVRFFLLWEDFQPAPDTVSAEQLNHLVQVLDAVGDHGLKAVPTLLVGNMSGVMWLPPWAFEPYPKQTGALQISCGRYVDREARSPFDDEDMLHAEDVLAEAVGGGAARPPPPPPETCVSRSSPDQ